MSLSPDDFEKVALLARLQLNETETQQLNGQLNNILDYIELLNEVTTDDVEPMAHPLPIQNVFRPDIEKPSLPVDEALANAPERIEDFYSVPPILVEKHQKN